MPFGDTVDAISRMIDQSYVRWAGLSEVCAATVERASRVYPVADLQVEYSIVSRGIEAGMLATIAHDRGSAGQRDILHVAENPRS